MFDNICLLLHISHKAFAIIIHQQRDLPFFGLYTMILMPLLRYIYHPKEIKLVNMFLINCYQKWYNLKFKHKCMKLNNWWHKYDHRSNSTVLLFIKKIIKMLVIQLLQCNQNSKNAILFILKVCDIFVPFIQTRFHFIIKLALWQRSLLPFFQST